jgi:glucokinase
MQVRDGLQRGIPSVLSARYLADPDAIDFEAVLGGVRRKDRLCLDELRVWISNVASLLVSAIHVYSPEVVILGGGASHGAKHFLPDLRTQVARRLFRWPKGSTVPIVVSEFLDHAGVLGAAAVAWENL